MSFSVFINFLYSQLLFTPPYPTSDCYGKTIIVTGANSGLGREAARHFTRLHASKIILAVRSLSRGEAAARDIEATTHRKGVVEVWQLDLSSYASVKEFAHRCSNDLPRIDAVVENAGVINRNFQTWEQDEATLTVNVVSTFLLALLLLPKLRECAKKFDIRPHIAIVSSEVHFFTNFPERASVRANETLFDALSDPARANMPDRYNVSKLLEVLACRAICAQHPQPPYPVTINCLNPGLCHSELFRDAANQWVYKLINNLLARRTEVGSRALVHAALAAGPETHGQYLSDCEARQPAPLVVSPEGKELQERVWRELGEKLERIQPGILQNV